MCSRSVSGSSLLSGYNEDDARETNGRSRREFEEIDSVLYNEEKAKRSSIKKICEEWSSRPHFRIRGRLQHIEKQSPINFIQSSKQYDVTYLDTTVSSTLDLLVSNSKISSSNSNDLNPLINETGSGRSSINSIEGSELTNNSDSDDNNATNTMLDDHSSDAGVDSFDTDDDDDDENNDYSADMSPQEYSKHHHKHPKNPQLSIKCMKDSIIKSLATKLLQRFFSEQQNSLQRYAKHICERNSIKLRSKLRPNSLPPQSLSQSRLSYPSATNTQLQMASTPYRSTPEPDIKGLLMVTRLHTANSGLTTNNSTSPRKSKILSTLPQTERVPTSLATDKRHQQQQISLIGTAVTNFPSSQLTTTASTPQSSQNQTRQPSSTYRYRSATTTHTEPNTRLPPINIERLMNNDQTTINRSNTTTSGIVESMPRAVSGTSIGSNPSTSVKLRIPSNFGKLQRTSRPITITSFNNTNKDFNNLSSTSPTRSITTTTAPSSSLRTTAMARTHQQHQKRPLIATKARPPPSPSILKLSAQHIW
ncbi:unnamed protein product [Adineta steineri]|uniref:Uncharacterized protein n=1 Tax=Adineta steineri TaxID=433720 RepID=A0A815TA91_9BILA|nr:unnamed protein product [Adineta steineri]CAF1503740.1 unnamed protein product [Adineta steineri]